MALNEARKRGDETEPPKTLPSEVERAYMTFAWHFLNPGLVTLAEIMRVVVSEVVGRYPALFSAQFCLVEIVD